MEGPADGTDRDRRYRHFVIERELANRLRRASKEERQSLYSEVYDELFRRLEMPGNSEAQHAQVGLLLELLDPFVGQRSRFLEYGAGSCDLSLALAQRLDRVWAVDAVDPALDPGSTPPGFSFVAAGDVRAVVPQSGVDVALSCHFVEHLYPEDLNDHLVQVFNLLGEDGVYLIITPNRIYGPHDISKGFSHRAEGLHLREYTHADLGREIRRAGFREIRAIGELGRWPRPGRLGAIGSVERVVDALPCSWRRSLLSLVSRKEPFRPLEQVKLAAFKTRPGKRPS